MKINKLNILGQILLLFSTIAWGTSFFILKETINTVPAFYVLALRFLISSGILALIFIKLLIKINKKTVFKGFIVGVVLAIAYVIQTIGLGFTTPAHNAFLTDTYCVLTPFIIWLFFKKKPKFYSFFAAIVCVIGMSLVIFSSTSNEGANNMLLGDLITAGCAVFYALQIILIDKHYGEGESPIAILILELLFAGAIFAVLSLIFELPLGVSSYSLNFDQFIKIAYLTIVCTLLAQAFMIFGQKYVTPNQASLILSMEAVFGALFSVLFGYDKLNPILVVGFIVILSAVLISEFKFDPIKLLKNKSITKQKKNN